MIWRALEAGEAEMLAAACVTFAPFRQLGYRSAALLDYFTRNDPALSRFAIEIDGGLQGILCLRRPWLRGPLIETLALLPNAQGRGLGSRVMQRCQAEAGKNLWATVSEFHLPARKFYERHGFRDQARLDGLVGAGQAEILLRWQNTP